MLQHKEIQKNEEWAFFFTKRKAEQSVCEVLHNKDLGIAARVKRYTEYD